MISSNHLRQADIIRKCGGLWLCALLFLLAGCQPQLPPTLQRLDLAPEGLTTEQAFALLEQRATQFQTLLGTGKVYIKNWEEKYKFSQLFVLERPQRFRLETLGFLNQPAIFFISDAAMLSLYAKKPNVYYRGVASQKNLFKLSGINLTVEDMILVLSGNPPKMTEISSAWGMYLADTQQYYLERISVQHKRIQRVWFDVATNTVAFVEEYHLNSGELTLKVAFADYRAAAGAYPIPAQVEINRPMDNVRVVIHYRDFDVNHTLQADTFAFTPPQNALINNIDDITQEELDRLKPFQEFLTQDNE